MSTGVIDQCTGQDILLAEMRHRVANSFQLLIGVSRFRLKNVETDEARGELSALIDLILSVGMLQQRLTLPEGADFAAYLRDAASIWGRVGASSGIVVEVQAVDELRLPSRTATTLALVVHEMVTNSLQHAFPDSGSGRIVIGLRRSAGVCELRVTDDGCGPSCAPPRNKDKTRPPQGLSLMDRLAAELGGAFDIGPGEPSGTTARVTFRT